MVTAAAPFAIFLGVAGTIALAFYAGWRRIADAIGRPLERYRSALERADIPVRAEQLALAVIGTAAALWTLYMVVGRPDPVRGIALFPVMLAVAFFATGGWVRARIRRRLEAFNTQLELVLRLMSSGMRAGLGLRQALVLVIDEAPDPAHREFSRVIGQSNIGVSIYDALDALAERMPSDEITMMSRAIRVQSQTGGNLAKILEHLAATIKERRRVQRRMRALTAEGRATAWIIGALPLVLAAFIMATQPVMRAALIGTTVGHITIGVVIGFEGLGALILRAILRFDP